MTKNPWHFVLKNLPTLENFLLFVFLKTPDREYAFFEQGDWVILNALAYDIGGLPWSTLQRIGDKPVQVFRILDNNSGSHEQSIMILRWTLHGLKEIICGYYIDKVDPPVED